MNIDLYSKTNTITDDLREYLQAKMDVFESHCPKEILRARIELEENKSIKTSEKKFRAEATITIPQHTFRAEGFGKSFTAAIDSMMPKLNKQAEKEKTKLKRRKR